MKTESPPNDGLVRVAEVEVDTVLPLPKGFRLDGGGEDGADYRLELRFEMPTDGKTRSVIGELLTQSQWVLYRKIHEPLKRVKKAVDPKRANAG